jgi:hypothetical protein
MPGARWSTLLAMGTIFATAPLRAQTDTATRRRPLMAIGQTIAINTFVNRVDDVIGTMYQGSIGFTFR